MYSQIQQCWQRVQSASQKVQDSITSGNFSRLLVQQLIEFAVAINDLKECIINYPDNEESQIWHQRQNEVHNQLLGLTAQGLQGTDPSQFWEHIGQLLYYSAVEIKQNCQKSQETGVQHSQFSGQDTQMSDGESNDVYAVKAKLIVVQQECQKKQQEVSVMNQRIKELENQCQKLSQEVTELSKEKAFFQSQFDSQGEVIDELMSKNENSERERTAAVEEAAQLREHNNTLSLNLEKHAQTIENLMQLNAQLTDSINTLQHSNKNTEIDQGGSFANLSAKLQQDQIKQQFPDSRQEKQELPSNINQNSFTSAFEHFLMGDSDLPKKATAATLSQPHSAHQKRSALPPNLL